MTAFNTSGLQKKRQNVTFDCARLETPRCLSTPDRSLIGLLSITATELWRPAETDCAGDNALSPIILQGAASSGPRPRLRRLTLTDGRELPLPTGRKRPQ